MLLGAGLVDTAEVAVTAVGDEDAPCEGDVVVGDGICVE